MTGETVTTVSGWRPGVVGEIVRLHARFYAEAWGFGPEFEAKVAAGLADFLPRCDRPRSALFTAWTGTRCVGSVAIDGEDAQARPHEAHLRWFIVSSDVRGQGVGAHLMRQAMTFLRTSELATCWLDTFAGLDAARALYERHGFVLVREAEAASWGRSVREQRFEWRAPISAPP